MLKLQKALAVPGEADPAAVIAVIAAAAVEELQAAVLRLPALPGAVTMPAAIPAPEKSRK